MEAKNKVKTKSVAEFLENNVVMLFYVSSPVDCLKKINHKGDGDTSVKHSAVSHHLVAASLFVCLFWSRGDVMVSALDSGREVRVRALAVSLCCVLGQDTLLSHCLFPPR